MAKPTPKKSPKKSPSKQEKEKPPLRRSPRKQEATSPSKINYYSESSPSQSDNEREKEVRKETPKSDEFIGSLTDMLEYYAERLLMSEREERLEILSTFQVSPFRNLDRCCRDTFSDYLVTLIVVTGILGYSSHERPSLWKLIRSLSSHALRLWDLHWKPVSASFR
jgi:hypothetical protein